MTVLLAATLTMVLIMPGKAPDVIVERPYPSVIDCLHAAHKWLLLDPHLAGGVGLAAGCTVKSDNG